MVYGKKGESKAWEEIRPVFLANGLDPVRVENSISEGLPDINYVHGWVELKHVPRFPVRPTTTVKCRHFTKEQRAFLKRREANGGKAFLLIKIEDYWALFKGAVAADKIGKITKSEFPLYALEFTKDKWRIAKWL